MTSPSGGGVAAAGGIAALGESGFAVIGMSAPDMIDVPRRWALTGYLRSVCRAYPPQMSPTVNPVGNGSVGSTT